MCSASTKYSAPWQPDTERIAMKNFLAIFTLLAASLFVSSANADLIFVGSWDVADPDAPLWFDTPPDGPLAYTGQEAAALLFGGSAADYAISTVDDNVVNINNMAWYDIIGVGGAILAQDYFSKYLGLYYGPTDTYTSGIPTNAASSYIQDNLADLDARNYAFRRDQAARSAAAPASSPSVLTLLLAGLLGVAAARRRTVKQAA
jgi:hypothetical protein